MSYIRGRFSTVDLLVLTSLDQLLLIMKILSTYFTKQVILMRRSIVLSLPSRLVFSGEGLLLSLTGVNTAKPFFLPHSKIS